MKNIRLVSSFIIFVLMLGCDNRTLIGADNPYNPESFNYASDLIVTNNVVDNFDATLSGNGYSTDKYFPLTYSGNGINGMVIDLQTSNGGMRGSLHLEFLKDELYVYSEDISNEGSLNRSTKIAPYVMPDQVRIQSNGFVGKVSISISSYGHH